MMTDKEKIERFLKLLDYIHNTVGPYDRNHSNYVSKYTRYYKTNLYIPTFKYLCSNKPYASAFTCPIIILCVPHLKPEIEITYFECYNRYGDFIKEECVNILDIANDFFQPFLGYAKEIYVSKTPNYSRELEQRLKNIKAQIIHRDTAPVFLKLGITIES